MSDNHICTFETAWCPGCGDINILAALKDTLIKMNKQPHEVLVVGGIGQAAKTPQYISTNGFSGLHGRSLPPAVAAKIANKNLTVIVDTGDGDAYGEGGNHFIHNVRRNVDITHFVHDNQIYGLTKGQTSPTSDSGSASIPMNPLLMAITLGAGFVARAFSNDKEYLIQIMEQAINHKGYALVDILQPCVTFNKVNTHQWYQSRVYKLDESYDPTNKLQAMAKAMEWGDSIPLGIIYKEERSDFHDTLDFLKNDKPLVDQPFSIDKISSFIKDFQ
jgi:2-oxoglutarate ferredoxin oxidoreductase subunit beta